MADDLSRHPKVRSDIQFLAEYIAADDLPAARRFVLAVENAISLIQTTPELGPLFPTKIERLEGIRSYPVPFPDHGRHRPYLIFYKPNHEGTRVLYVFHGSRDIPAHFKKDVRY